MKEEKKELNKVCDFCNERGEKVVKLLIQDRQDEEGTWENFLLCKGHLKDYEEQVGIFEPWCP